MIKQLKREDASSLVAQTIAAVRTVEPGEFCKPDSAGYRNVRSGISKLAWGIETEPDAFHALLSAHEHSTACWLPLEREQIAAMSTLEILLRLKINVSGERWIDGALVKPFTAGTLLSALERIEADLDALFTSS